MAAEYQIYLRDDLVNQNHSTNKRMTPEITEQINNIVPPNIVSKRIHQTNQGFIVTYSNDSDINYIFDPLIIDSLKEKNLSATLASDTQVHRQAVVSGLSNNIYSKTNAELVIEIEQRIPGKILHLHKYKSNKNYKCYIFITFDSCALNEQTIVKGSINLFETNCLVQKPLPKQPSTYHQTRQHQQTNFLNVSPSVDTRTPPPIWPALRKTQSRGHPTHLSSNIATSGSSDFDFKLFVEVTSKICEVISNGMENPEAYVSLMNNSFSQQGIPPVFIPASDLCDSRKLFLVNSTLNPLSSNTVTKPPPTTQSSVPHTSSTAPTNLSIHQPKSQSSVSSTSSPVSLTQTAISSTVSISTTSTTPALSSSPIPSLHSPTQSISTSIIPNLSSFTLLPYSLTDSPSSTTNTVNSPPHYGKKRAF